MRRAWPWRPLQCAWISPAAGKNGCHPPFVGCAWCWPGSEGTFGTAFEGKLLNCLGSLFHFGWEALPQLLPQRLKSRCGGARGGLLRKWHPATCWSWRDYRKRCRGGIHRGLCGCLGLRSAGRNVIILLEALVLRLLSGWRHTIH